jgi:t-SNARE complex subunit (syntaxin)
MWDSWLEFQAEIKRSKDREEAEEAHRRYLRKKRISEICTWIGISIVAVVFVISAIFTTLAIVK